MDLAIKNQIVNHYLSQQFAGQGPSHRQGYNQGQSRSGSVKSLNHQSHPNQNQNTNNDIDVPTVQELEEFKSQVHLWMETDTSIKKLKGLIKEKKSAMDLISEQILAFMARFNIEDLNTKDGKLKYRVSQIKTPIARAEIKTRLIENYDPKLTANDLASKIFDESQQPVKEKRCLRRSK
jgi:hypothetical protein